MDLYFNDPVMILSRNYDYTQLGVTALCLISHLHNQVKLPSSAATVAEWLAERMSFGRSGVRTQQILVGFSALAGSCPGQGVLAIRAQGKSGTAPLAHSSTSWTCI